MNQYNILHSVRNKYDESEQGFLPKIGANSPLDNCSMCIRLEAIKNDLFDMHYAVEMC